MKRVYIGLVLSSLLFVGCTDLIADLSDRLIVTVVDIVFGSGDDSSDEVKDDFTAEIVIPTNELWYTSTDGEIIEPSQYAEYAGYGENFDVDIISNTYENGKGVITFDGDVTTINDYAFKSNYRLKSVVIPNKVTRIGDEAFGECDYLESVAIPYSVEEIGADAFLWPVSLKEFRGKYASADGRCLIKDDTIIAYAYGSGVNFTIPRGVKYIPDDAFSMCESLKGVTLPDGLECIGAQAFCETSITCVRIPDSVISMGMSVFAGCQNLEKFTGKYASRDFSSLIIDERLNSFALASGITDYTVPYYVTSIDDWAFMGCSSLKSVTIQESMSHIGEGSLCDCENLSAIYCKAPTPPIGGEDMFANNAPECKIYVPAASVEAYKNAEFWSDYADAIVGYDFE